MNRTVNNKFKTSPAIMNDGRSFTDYRPACYVDSMIAHNNKISGSNEYREFLIQNGLHLMRVNDMYIEDKMEHRNCNQTSKPGSEFAKVCQINSSTMSCLDTDPRKTGILISSGDQQPSWFLEEEQKVAGSRQQQVSGFDKSDLRFQSL